VKDSAGVQSNAQVLAASPTQINFVVPATAGQGSATVTASLSGGSTISGAAFVSNVAPAFFSANSDGKGVAAALALTVAPDGAQTSQYIFDPAAPAGSRKGAPIDVSQPGTQVYLLLFRTGMRNATQKTVATVGGVPVNVAGPVAQSQYAGLDQVNLGPLPASLAGRCEVDIVLNAPFTIWRLTPCHCF